MSEARAIPGGRTVEWGQWNVCEAFIGPPGCGKTEAAVARLLELQRAHGAYVIAHDPGFRIPAKLHDGTPTGVRRHQSIEACAAALRERAGGVHALLVTDGAEVLAFARRVAAAALELHGRHRDGQPRRGVPVLCYLDEAVQMADASPHRLGDTLREALTQRRAWHVGLVFTVQSARFAHYAMVTQSTELHLFRMTSRRDLEALEHGGVPGEVLAELPTLPRYKAARYRAGG